MFFKSVGSRILSTYSANALLIRFLKISLVSFFQGEDGDEIPPVVPINVGGHRFMTRRSTLCKYEDSMLAAMFSGRHQLDKDRNGKCAYQLISGEKFLVPSIRYFKILPVDTN